MKYILLRENYSNKKHTDLIDVIGNHRGYLDTFTKIVSHEEQFKNNTYNSVIQRLRKVMNDITKYNFKIDINETSLEGLEYSIKMLKYDRFIRQLLKTLPNNYHGLITNDLKLKLDDIYGIFTVKEVKKMIMDNNFNTDKELINLLSDNINYSADMEVFKNDRYLVLHVRNFEESAKLKIKNWVISYAQHYWDMYVPEGYVQYVVYDRNYNPDNGYFSIGVTVDESGAFKHSYDRNDREYDMEHMDASIKKLLIPKK